MKLSIFDDIIFDERIIRIACECFIHGRHLRISCIFISQNLFLNNKYLLMISLNCSHENLFQMRDLKQIKFFVRRKNRVFSKLYRKEVLNKDNDYLFIKFSKKSKLQKRNKVFNRGLFEKIYIL